MNLADKLDRIVMDHSDTSSEMEAPFEDDYRHRRLSMHRTANIRSLRAGATSPDDREHTSYSNMEETANDHVNQIVDKIVEEEACLLGESAMTGMEYRQDALKNMPQSLTMKKMVKERLHLRMTQSKRVSGWKQMKYNMSLSSRKCRSKFQDFLMIFELWNGTMKKIEGEFGSATAIYFRFFRHLFLLNCVTFFFCFCFIALPEIIHLVSKKATKTAQFNAIDLLTGQGYLETSILFYGYYQNITIHVANNFSYSMPLAYFYTMICVYGLLLLVLAISMMRSYRVNFIETKGGLKNIFAHKVFCTWDFSIATENASRLKSSAIYHEFKELLEEELRSHEQLSCKSKFFTFMLRLAGHLLVLVVVGASGYGIWALLELHWVADNSDWGGLFTAIVINAVIYIVPVIFSLIAHHEDYKNPRKAFNITLLRTFILHAAIIGVLAGFWLFRAHKISGCWETKLGQEVYRLLLVDFFFALGFFVGERLLRCIWAMFARSKMERPEFEIAKHTVHLIYNQALFWLGLLFTPVLGALIVIKFLIMWYFTTVVEIKFSKPSTKFWRATNTHTWFLVITFVTALLIMAVLGCIMALVYASNCGPFGSSLEEKKYIYDFLKDEILKMEQGVMVLQILAYLLKPGVVAVVITVMMGFIYYLRARALAQQKMVSVLREMIVIESKDKDFLLQRIRMLAKEWKFTSCATTDPMMTPTEKLYKQQENQTEFHRNQETVVPQRADDWTSMSSGQIPSVSYRNKSKRH